MESIKPAPFSLQDYQITKFTLTHLEGDVVKEGLNIEFDPSGYYQEELGIFHLEFGFKAFYGEDSNIEEKNIVRASMGAKFVFAEKVKFDEIPEFFYINSIAIVFPHMRAFISTVTTLANVRRLILPLLNLTSLESILKNNTTVLK